VLADNNAALAGLVTASIVVPLAILAVVIWFFRKSAKRFDAEQEQEKSQRSEAPGRR
jgi:membrane protein implicated in regulation of membrane protease activity